ncbi:MAG: prolipoprotein diacylglyceryl transferase [candidate division Zixibacteria bacterium RBG_16_50_21]|nr:MAG: prolipoprotein diacylglyceryl transferase [candidate division Zixibacteria bacterium RBG_16_50_21]
MHPELIRFGPLAIRSYGLLLAISFLLGVIWSVRRANKVGVNPKIILDLTIVIFISSIVGARMFYVIFHLEEFRGHWLDVISPVQSNGDFVFGGLTMLGGVVLAVLCGIVYLRIKKQSVWKVADVLAPAFPLGIFLTRIGCFLNGCCYGKPSPQEAWGVVFPADCPAGYAYPGIHLYPTQLYSSLKGLLILIILVLLERYKKFDGYTFWLMLFVFGIGRFVIDFWRYYEPSMVLATIQGVSFSVNQGVSLIIIFVSATMWNLLRAKSHKPLGAK